jgi:hypothetical protein
MCFCHLTYEIPVKFPSQFFNEPTSDTGKRDSKTTGGNNMTGYIGSRNLVLEEKIRSEKMVEEELEKNGKSFLQPFVIGKHFFQKTWQTL